MTKRITLFIVFNLLIIVSLLGQIKTIGAPVIENYLPSNYNAKTQNWAIIQDRRGVMYFGNNSGLLEFDGTYWRLIQTPNRSAVRSLAIDEQGKIYIGAIGDFGYLETDSKGNSKYVSLAQKIPEKNRDFNNVWKVFVTSFGVVFHTYNALYIYKNGKIKVIKLKGKGQLISMCFYVNNVLYFSETKNGKLLAIKDEKYQIINVDKKNELQWVTSMIALEQNRILITTYENGVFVFEPNGEISREITDVNNNLKIPLSKKLQDFIRENQVMTAVKLDRGNIAFGTNNGLLIIDKTGNIIQYLNKKRGLQDDTVFKLFFDKYKNLWLALNSGISRVEINSPFTLFNDQLNLNGIGTSSIIYDDKLYLGTLQGNYYQHSGFGFKLYSGNSSFQKVEGSKTQNWDFTIFNGKLLSATSQGIFEIINNKAKQLLNTANAYSFLLVPNHPNQLLVSTDYGLVKCIYNQKQWVKKEIIGFNELAGKMEIDETGNIWVSNLNKGIFKLKLTASQDSVQDLQLYTSKNGLPYDFKNIVVKINNKVKIITGKGVFQYDAVSDSFKPDPIFQNIFGDEKYIFVLKEDNQGNLWYAVSENIEDSPEAYYEGVLIRQLDGSYQNNQTPLKKFSSKIVFNIIPHAHDQILIAGENGFIHYNPTINKDYKAPFTTLIRKVETITGIDSLIFNGSLSKNNNNEQSFSSSSSSEIPYENNSIRFTYAASWYENTEKTKYEYFLEGFDNQWSNATQKTEKEYTNIPEGEYTFCVKARNVFDTESNIATYKFRISPPWYRTYYSYFSYLLAGVLGIWIIVRLNAKRLESENKRLEKIVKERSDEIIIQKEEIYKKEKEKLDLEKHQLALEVENKNIESERLIAEKKLEKEKSLRLQLNLDHKNRELISNTMFICSKNEVLEDINKQLGELVNGNLNNDQNKKIKTIKKLIKENIDLNNDWENLKLHFDRVHPTFFEKLQTEFPDLTPNELKLCAYLKINLSTKETARILNVSVKGVQMARYRLKKKLNLNSDQDLPQFINQI